MREIQREEEEERNNSRPPFNMRWSIVIFLFVYVGLIIGFSGWIPYYALESDVTSSYSRAAYLSSIFYIALTVGRFISIGLSVYWTSSAILKLELSLLIVSAVLGLVLLDLNYAATASITALISLSLCAIYPIMLTIVDEFHYRV